MPKIWQNLRNVNHWLTDSPTWIQEMLAHLKKYRNINLGLGNSRPKDEDSLEGVWLNKRLFHFAKKSSDYVQRKKTNNNLETTFPSPTLHSPIDWLETFLIKDLIAPQASVLVLILAGTTFNFPPRSILKCLWRVEHMDDENQGLAKMSKLE